MRVDTRFVDLYEREFEPVFHTAYLLCRDHDLAEEATQEAFARAFERWDRLADAAWVAGWVTSTALNVVRRGLRRRSSRRLPDATRVAPDPDLTVDLWRAVAKLPPRQQQAIVLTYRLDYDTRASAQAMGCGEPAVRAYLARARRTLAETLGNEHDAPR